MNIIKLVQKISLTLKCILSCKCSFNVKGKWCACCSNEFGTVARKLVLKLEAAFLQQMFLFIAEVHNPQLSNASGQLKIHVEAARKDLKARDGRRCGIG